MLGMELTGDDRGQKSDSFLGKKKKNARTRRVNRDGGLGRVYEQRLDFQPSISSIWVLLRHKQ